jgi:hypothetical protein
MDVVHCLLAKTPCLTHLSVIGDGIPTIAVGRLWENMFKETVPLLINFELYAGFTFLRNRQGNDAEVELKRSIASFSSPFWTQEKRWLVICNWLVNRNQFEIFTSPTCTRSAPLVFDENIKTMSNFDRELRPSTMSDFSYQSCAKLYTEILFQSKVSFV